MGRRRSGPSSRLTFDGLLDRSYSLVVEVDAEDPRVSGELKHDALHVGTIAGAMLRAEPEPHEDLVARRGHEGSPGSPTREVDVAVGERGVSHPRADVADRTDHVGAQLLGPVPLSRCGVSQGRPPYELERGNERGDRYAVDPRADERTEPLPVGADERVQVEAC